MESDSSNMGYNTTGGGTMYQAFAAVTVSIFLEGIFFLLLGVIFSGIIEVFVSEETIRKMIPANRWIGLLSASLLGLLFPICECGIVPVIHRLLKKGVPLHLCTTLLFSSPIVNVVVALSTYFAFQDYPYMVILRVLGGFLISCITGFVVSISFKTGEVVKESAAGEAHGHCCHDCGGESAEMQQGLTRISNVRTKLKSVISHSIEEFWDTGRYFLVGIFI